MLPRKEKQNRFFFSRETYTKIIVIDLIIVELFGICPVVFFPSLFPSKRKGFPCKFCVLVCDCYFGLLLLLIILFGAQQIVSELRFSVEAMAREEGKASGIEKFDGTDFGYWRMQIEDYLYGKKLHLPLLRTKPEIMKDEN